MPGMSDKQKLYPHRVYQLNRSLEELWREMEIAKGGLEGVNETVGLNFLRYYTRMFNWLVVNKERWRFSKEICKNILKCRDSEQHKEEWKGFFKKLKGENSDVINESIEYLKKLENVGSNEVEEFHFHLINLYQSFPVKSDLFLDGIIYRNFRKYKKRLLYAKADLLIKDSEYTIYPRAKTTFYFEGDGKRRKKKDKVKYDSAQEKKEDLPVVKTPASNGDKLRFKYKIKLEDKIYFRYLVPIFVGYPYPGKDGKDKEIFTGKFENNKYLFELNDIKEVLKDKTYRYFLCVPVYDAFIEKRSYGNFLGNLSFSFKTKQNRIDFIKKMGTMDWLNEHMYLFV